MLKGLRKNTKVIIWSVIFCFIMWGGYSVGTQFRKEGRVAGEIFGKEVSFQEYNRFLKAAEIFSFGEKSSQNADELEQLAWQNLILSREAQRQKIGVSDEEVRTEVLRLLANAKIDDPSPDFYRRWLEVAFRETPAEFEKKIREYLRIQKLIAQVQSAPEEPPSENEILKQYRIENASLAVSYALFPTQNEAVQFKGKIKTAEDWKKETSVFPKESVVTTALKPVSELGQSGMLPTDLLFQMEKMKAGDLSEVFPRGNQFGIAFLIEKKEADPQKLDAALKEKIKSELVTQKRYFKFMVWNAELRSRANFKNFLRSDPATGS